MYPRFILIAALIPALLLSYTTKTSAFSPNEIDTLANIVKQEELSLQSWQVIVKEKIDSNRVAEVKRKISSHFSEQAFSSETSEETTKQIIRNGQDTKLKESFTIIESNHLSQQAEIIYTISGEEWDDRSKDLYSQKLGILLNGVFSENMTKFSCVITQPSDNINSVYEINNVVKKLDVQILDFIHEEDFSVISGYTPRWNTAIPISDDSMNFQMAAREGMGGKTTITIGTPIITVEY